MAQIQEVEDNVRCAAERGVDPASVVESSGRLQQKEVQLEARKAEVHSAGRVLHLTHVEVREICCAVGNYLVKLEETLDGGNLGNQRSLLRPIVDRVIVGLPQNIATV